MIAELLELHELGQYQSSAFHAVDIFESQSEVAHGLFVEGGLLAAQITKDRHLDLFGQVADHSLVGLQPPEDVR